MTYYETNSFFALKEINVFNFISLVPMFDMRFLQLCRRFEELTLEEVDQPQDFESCKQMEESQEEL